MTATPPAPSPATAPTGGAWLPALGVLLVGWVVFTGPIWFSAGDLCYPDASVADVPRRLWAARELRAGRFPCWTDQLACGFPLFAEGQTGILYPPFLWYVLWPTQQAHDVFTAGHYLLLALGTFAWLGRWTGWWGAALGGLSLLTSQPAVQFHTQPCYLETLAWLPVSLGLIDRWRAGSWRALAAGAAVNAVVLLAGDANPASITFTLQGFYLWFHGGITHWRAWLTPGIVLLASPGALAAVQLAPTYEYLSASNRGASAGVERFLPGVVTWSFLWDGKHPVFPDQPPRWERAWWPPLRPGMQAGLALVAGLGLLARWRRPEARFWAVLFVLGLWVSTDMPGSRWWWSIPPYSWFRWPANYLFFSLVGLTYFVAAGGAVLSGWLSAELAAGWPRRLALPMVWLLLAVACGEHHLGLFMSDRPWAEESRPTVAESAPRGGHVRFWSQAEPVASLSAAGVLEVIRGTARLPVPDANLDVNVSSAELYAQNGTVSPRELTELYFDPRQPRKLLPLLRTAAVTHLVSDGPLVPELAEEFVVETRPAGFLSRRPASRTVAWLVGETETIASREARLARLNQADWNPRRTVVVEAPAPPGERTLWPAQCAVQRPRPAQMVIDVENPAPGFLVVADSWTAAARALRDGQSVPLWRTNHAFRGLPLEAGRHRVWLGYWPATLWWGALISAPAWTLLGLQLVGGWPTSPNGARWRVAGWMLVSVAIVVGAALGSRWQWQRRATELAPADRWPARGDSRWDRLGWSLEPDRENGFRLDRLDSTGEGVRIGSGDAALSHWELSQIGFALRANVRYTLRFRARADATRELAAGCGPQEPAVAEPSRSSFLRETVTLDRDWQEYELEFHAPRDEPRARWWLGGAAGVPVELGWVELARDEEPVTSELGRYFTVERALPAAAGGDERCEFRVRAGGPVTVHWGFAATAGSPLDEIRPLDLEREWETITASVPTGAAATGVRFVVPLREPGLAIQGLRRTPADGPAEAVAEERGNWSLWTRETSRGQLHHGTEGLRIELVAGASLGLSDVVLHGPSRGWEAGSRYRLVFSARSSESPRTIGLSVAQAREPWSSLGCFFEVPLTSDWHQIAHTFTATSSDEGRVQFLLGGPPGAVEIRQVEVLREP